MNAKASIESLQVFFPPETLTLFYDTVPKYKKWSTDLRTTKNKITRDKWVLCHWNSRPSLTHE